MEEKIEVFIAFDKEDMTFVKELKNHLIPLEMQGLITVWDVSQIIGGTDWKQAIDDHLKTASIILLLVSADFMASKEAYDLAKQAMAKNAPPKVYVVPILLHEVDWEYSDFGTLAPLPSNRRPIGSWPNRNAAFLEVVKGIREIVTVLKTSSVSDQSSLLSSATNSHFFVPRIITQELFEELIEITAKVSVAKGELISIYRNSGVPAGWPFPEFSSNDEVEILALMVRDLTQIDVLNTGTVPLLAFIKFLANHTSERSVQDAFALWIQKASKKIGIEEQRISLREETVPAAQSPAASFHLLIRFKPNCNKPEDEFYVHAWFLREQNGKVEYLDIETKEEVYQLGATPTFLDDLIMQCENHVDQFTVELLLPFTLLNHDTCDVHQWGLDVDFGNTALVAHKYPLVLRSYDRAYEGKRSRSAWESNWTICKGPLDMTKLEMLKKSHYAQKEDYLIVYLEKATCLAMTFVPSKFDSGQPHIHIFTKMMSAGTSVALWPRSLHEALDEEVVEQAYQALLAGCNFSELPKRMLERRRGAPEDKSLLVNTLTLFLDNPYLLPLDIPRKSPLAAAQERK